MLGRSSGNHDWLLANASDCVWMETGLQHRATAVQLMRCSQLLMLLVTTNERYYTGDETGERRKQDTPSTVYVIHHCLLTVSAASSKHFYFQIRPYVFTALEIFLPMRCIN